jgi:hypothetical protein
MNIWSKILIDTNIIEKWDLTPILKKQKTPPMRGS